MRQMITKLLLLLVMLLNTSDNLADDNRAYVVMQSDLDAIKADFNNAADKVRLVFIVGPS